jgi:hypothetical protein
MERIYADDPLESLANFHGHMSRKLIENYHKGGWRHDSIESLRKRISEELDELDTAIANGRPYEVIAREAADVANMVMMLQDRFWSRPLEQYTGEWSSTQIAVPTGGNDAVDR